MRARLGVVVLLAAASPARAEHAVTIAGDPDGCPSPRAFADALRTIFPDVAIDGDRDDALRVELTDSGSSYRMAAGTAAREIADPGRRCEERARNAAVFVALVLEPPAPGSLVDAPPVPERSPPGPRPTLRLGIGALLDAAPRSQNTLASGGGRIEVVVGGGRIAALAGVDLVTPTTMELGVVRARLTRVPFSVGARATWWRGRSALSLDAAGVIAIQITSGLDTSTSSEQTRLELGLRAAARLEYWGWRRLAPFIAIQGEVDPSPYDLVWSGMGIVGTTPRGWLGASIGCEFAVR